MATAEQSSTTTSKFGIIHLSLSVSIPHARRPVDAPVEHGVSSWLSYLPHIFEHDWPKQDRLHSALHNGFRDGINVAIPEDGISAEIKEFRLEPELDQSLSDDDLAELAWLISQITANAASSLIAVIQEVPPPHPERERYRFPPGSRWY